MDTKPVGPTVSTVLVVCATGSIGRLVVAESVRRGHRTRALVRDAGRASAVDPGAEAAVGDMTDSASLREIVPGVNAVVLS